MGFIETITDTVKARREGGRAGSHDAKRGTMWTTPWMCRDEDGLYGGWNLSLIHISEPTRPY